MDDQPLGSVLAARLNDETLSPYLGFCNWETYLGDEDLMYLALYRCAAADDTGSSDDFSLNYARTTPNPELNDDLADAKTPEERARLYFEHELSCYPFHIDSPVPL